MSLTGARLALLLALPASLTFVTGSTPVGAASAAAPYRPTSYVVTLVQESRPGKIPGRGPTTYPHLPIYPGLARVQARVFWQRGKWSESQKWLIPPPRGYTSLAAIDSEVLPGTMASDGFSAWYDDPYQRTVTVYPRDPAGTWPSTQGILLNHTYYGLKATLHDRCVPAHFDGNSTVAGRPVYIVTLGISPCVGPDVALDPNGPPAAWQPGKTVVWADRQTNFALRTDVYFKNEPKRLMTRDYVTSIRYNVPLSASLFRLAVPRGYRLIHAH